MGILSWFSSDKKKSIAKVRFGRFTDLYKDDVKKKKWDIAIIAYNEEEYHKSYLNVLDYLANEREKNVELLSDIPYQLKFRIYQGSKVALGYTDKDYFYAEVKIARCTKQNLAVYRTILEENYDLRFSKYCLDQQNNINLLFQTRHLDANPYKLYYGLKELLTTADHRDDALLKRHKDLQKIESNHIQYLDSYVIKSKFEFFKFELNKLLNYIDKESLMSEDRLGGFVFLVCAFAYKMDCLLLPEGVMMQRLEKIITLSNTLDAQSLMRNLPEIMRELQALNIKSLEDFRYEFYSSTYTFGVTTPIDIKRIIQAIHSNLEHIRWYVSQENDVLSEAVCTYTFGKLIYEHALPEFAKELILIYFRITESYLFNSIGYEGIIKRGKIKKSLVLERIKELEVDARNMDKSIRFDTDLLIWDKKLFGSSFTNMILRSTT